MIIKSLSLREKKLTILTVTVIGCAILYALVLEPAVKHYVDLDRQLTRKKLQVVKSRWLYRQRDLFETEYAKYVEYTKSSASEEEKTISILKEIENLARTNRVYIKNIKPAEVKRFGFYEKYTFNLSTEAEAEELLSFMYSLQTSKQLLKVERFTLSSKRAQPKVLKGNLKITKISVL